MHRRSLFALVGLVVVSAWVSAQAPCGGNLSSAGLSTSPQTLGSPGTIRVTGLPNAGYLLALSPNLMPQNIPGIGWLCLSLADPSLVTLSQGLLDGSGGFDLNLAIPNDPGLLPFLAYLQAGTLDPSVLLGWAVSPAVRVDFEQPDTPLAVASLPAPRALATAVRMTDGRALLVGGGGGSLVSPSGSNDSDIFDPVLRTWSSGAAMSLPRAAHASVPLNDGRVLVTGGSVDGMGTVTDQCEIYDPTTGVFGPAGTMNRVRAGHTLTLLQDGRVLAAGGTSTFNLPTGSTNIAPILNAAWDDGEVYDPATDLWTPVSGPMASKRFLATAVRLNDGRVLIMSGLNGAITIFTLSVPTWTPTCSVYDPASNSFASAPSLATSASRCAASAGVLPDGRVWLAGGATSLIGVPTSTSTTQLFNGTSWSAGPALPVAVTLPGMARLFDGSLFVAGGITGDLINQGATTATARYDGTALVASAPLPGDRGGAAVLALLDGTVLIAGGADTAATAQPDAWLYHR